MVQEYRTNDPYKDFDIICQQEGIAYLNQGQAYELYCATKCCEFGMRGPKSLKKTALVGLDPFISNINFTSMYIQWA